MKLFGTDGVRGKAGEFLTASLALKLAQSAGIYFKKEAKTNKILLGKDTRRSGYMIENALVSGLTSVGFNVIQIGPMPTAAISFLTESMRCDAGIMLSASHNPYYDNGIKFFDKDGNKLSNKAEKEIERIYFNEQFNDYLCINNDIGSSKRIDDVIGRYIVTIKNSFPKDLSLKNLRIVLDCANGAAYKVAPIIFDELGADLIVLNNTPNGININDDCGALYPKNLAKEVIKYRADIGIALDGDADRLVVVDNKGNVINGDKLIGALGLFLKEENRLNNNSCVTTILSNLALEEFFNKHNIKLYRSDVGDKNVLSLLNKYNLNFGAEESGHIIFKDFIKTGDGILASLQVLALLLKKNKPASDALNLFELSPVVKENIVINKKIPFNEIDGYDKIIKELRKQGIREVIRYSGTENKLRLLLEGNDINLLNQNLLKISDFFKKILI